MKPKFAALSIVLATAIAFPATAGGTFTFSLNARNGETANAIRSGLVMYQIHRDIESNGHISQNGLRNLAGLSQGGRGNIGIIHQDGNGHTGSIQQHGNYNSCGLFQFGRNTNGHIRQRGNGGACVMFQAGF